jgi:hypothetical protein
MPVDLNRLFASLGSDADSVPVPEVGHVRSRGNRRRAHHALSVAAAACVAVALVVGGAAVLRRHTEVVNVTGGSGFAAGGPVRFIPLRPLGTPLSFSDPAWGPADPPPGRAAAAVLDDRAVLTWQRADGSVLMGGASLSSGAPLFGPAPVGRYDTWSLTALPVGILVDGIQAGIGGRTISLVDADNGATRWRVDLASTGVDVFVMHAALVVASRADGEMRGLDWNTGRTLWMAKDPSGASQTTLAMVKPFDYLRPDPGGPSVFATDLVLRVGRDGVVRTYDAGTGRETGHRAAAGGEVMAFDGTVYAVAADPHRLLTYPVNDDRPARVIYQAPPGTTGLRSLAPCGVDRICLIEDGTSGGLAVAVDVATGVRRVLAPASPGDSLRAVGNRPLLDGRGTGRPALLDPAGGDATPLVPAGAPAYAARVDPTAVLSFEFAPGPSLPAGDEYTDLWIFGIYPEDGSLRPLGKVIVSASGCSFDNRFLVCPTRTGLGIWRFAG